MARRQAFFEHMLLRFLLGGFALLSLAGCDIWTERANFTETWHFITPTGPREVTGQFEVIQEPAMPFLPGGDVGKTTLSGHMNVDVFGQKMSFEPFGPMLLHQKGNGANGRVNPGISLDGLRNEYTTGFVRRARNSAIRIVVERDGIAGPGIAGAGFTLTDGGTTSLADLEGANPGVALHRVTLQIVPHN